MTDLQRAIDTQAAEVLTLIGIGLEFSDQRDFEKVVGLFRLARLVPPTIELTNDHGGRMIGCAEHIQREHFHGRITERRIADPCPACEDVRLRELAGEQAWEIPTRPYTVIDAINRSAAATGSVRYAQLAEGGDYNGHHVAVYFNDYRGYWLAEYHWGERVVLRRGSLLECAEAAAREFERGARGASAKLVIDPKALTSDLTRIDVGYLEALGFVRVPLQASARYAPLRRSLPAWWTWKHGEAGHAVDLERRGWGGAIAALLASETLEAWHSMKWADRRPAARA
jgi:hypothetical protein